MPEPLTIASLVIGVLCLLAVLALGALLLCCVAFVVSRDSSGKSWRSLKKTVRQQEEADLADAKWRAAGRGLGYNTDSLPSE
ncbi:hypothetical protein [Allorhodopirellula heiligendammensis]|uniref:Uncharacterized protein n=1 Tax=Allorhodopirellula heiligendammensis TaxID=2714739 RepID=A0A5C6C1W0_9BACT|nr:hypothetical protein [Allorhodopirellula heiligendammensis]TWU17977.1 hypothetical protein Poly21_01300 [Allorhodopirellula heiligendammensis]